MYAGTENLKPESAFSDKPFRQLVWRTDLRVTGLESERQSAIALVQDRGGASMT